MATAAILVNGLPASGKSTLAAKLGLLLGCPVLAKDPLKEHLAELSGPTVSGATLGGIAMDTLWTLAAAVPQGVIVDSFWLSTRDREFARAGVGRSAAERVVEIWCDVPEAVAHARVETRQRHPIHGADFGAWAGAQPLALWPVVNVDTRSAVDFEALLLELKQHLLG